MATKKSQNCLYNGFYENCLYNGFSNELLVSDGFLCLLLVCDGFFIHIVVFKIIFSMKRGYAYVWGICMFVGVPFNIIINVIIF